MTELTDIVTHTRASGATYLDSTGTLQTAASGEIRDQAYTYVDGVLTGPYLQLESAAATNLVTYSEDFTDASWAKIDATVTNDATGSPDGNSNADKMVEDSGTVAPRLQDTISVTSGNAYTMSVFAKSSERDKIQINYSGIPLANFDLTAESATSASDGSFFTDIVGRVEPYGGGWYRCSVSANCIQNLAGQFRVYLNPSALSVPSYTGDGSSGIFIYGAQFETGSIPTSYIPTSGSTATRAAETLTIPNPPWPATVEATGTELVTNGAFDTDTSGWTAGGSASLSQSNGELIVTSTTAFGRAEQNVGVLSAGSVYELTVDFISTTGASGKAGIKIDNTLGTFSVSGGASVGTHRILFPGSSSYNTISIGDNGDASAVTVFDNISVKEITPRGLAIAMDGLVTYADNNSSTEATLLRWEKDSNSNINIWVRTDTTPDQVLFWQIQGGTADLVSGGSVGVNVPFSIASRHGDNFINGAVDGTALTADLTPTILPDLSATSIQIAPTFNGYIDTFRVWVEDIGDAGISEAST